MCPRIYIYIYVYAWLCRDVITVERMWEDFRVQGLECRVCGLGID